MAGVNGGKFPAIREHLDKNIGGVYKDMDLTFDEYPKGGKVDPEAYKEAIDSMSKGDAVIIFTPDLLVTKPAVQLLSHHNELIAAAKKYGVVCMVEHHKRCDSDKAIPTRVVASAATGIATSEPYNCVPQTEDTITLLVDWESTTSSKHKGTGVYTASWTAPLKAGVHSAQHWYYMGEKGDITVDQAHRGYDVTVDDTGKTCMKYSPSESGHFDGQRGYGYVSIEKFIDAARSVNAGHTKVEDYDKHGLPTIANTVLTTAILHAGRISLDEKRPVGIKKNGEEWILE
ncbi:hypothetical protein HHX47_DHR1001566 [Lentinula edodes]|nr:hypothetical protein HHX47_DHR1001566 [Lentinula edodes]